MGDHYVPQFYLRNFTEKKKFWVYDKNDSEPFLSTPQSVANETNYYSPETEAYLANVIEPPAKYVIDKIINQEPLTDQDKLMFSRYMSVMFKRAPAGKELVQSLQQEAAHLLYRKKSELEGEEKDSEILDQIQEELDIYTKSVPKDIWLEILPPEQTPIIVYVMYKMTWRFITSTYPSNFLTSDNPLFVDLENGAGHPNTAITFPISSSITLWTTWPHGAFRAVAQGYHRGTKEAIHFINHRTIANATRYIFSAINFEWLPKVIKQHRYGLRR